MRHRSRRRLRRIRNWFRSATTPNQVLFPRAIGSAEVVAPDPDPTMMVVTGLFDWDDRPRVLPIHRGPDADRPPGRRPNTGRFR